MPKQDALSIDLGILLEKAYTLIQERNLYDLRKELPKLSDRSFTEYIRMGWKPKEYNEWFISLKEVFLKYGLQIAKFRKNADTYNPDKNMSFPAILFLRRVDELERIHSNQKYLSSYFSPTAFPTVNFKQGVITQGLNRHAFVNKSHKDLLSLLWGGRRIISPTKKVLRKEAAVSRDFIYSRLNVNHERFTDIVRGIKGEAKKKNIHLSIYYPNDIYIQVVQDTV